MPHHKQKIILFFCFVLFSAPLFAQQTVGLFQNDSSAFNGYTLFAPTGNTTTYLIDNCGRIINSWQSSYSAGSIAYLLPDGDLLRAARINSAFTAGGTGGRLERFSWDGTLEWAYTYSTNTVHQHHDIEPLPNGNILILAWEKFSQADAIAAGRSPSSVGGNGIWSEHIIEIEPLGSDDATIVWEWHVWDHLIQDIDDSKDNYGEIADHPERIDINFISFLNPNPTQSDWLHANAVDYNPDLDQVMISCRNFEECWVIDHSTTSAEASGTSGGNSGKGGDLLYRWGNPASYGRGASADKKLFGQHDFNWVPEGLPGAGQILVFNNGLGRPDGTFSTVEQINPPIDLDGNYQIQGNDAFGPLYSDTVYIGLPPSSFYSQRISGAQRLPNGNTLICEGIKGKFIEVDPSGKIVWEYINPVRPNGPVTQGQIPSGNDVFRAYRYGPDYSAFTDKDLTPGDPIEFNPLDSDCVIFGIPTAITESEGSSSLEFSLSPNPFPGGQLQVQGLDDQITGPGTIAIFDLTGRLLVGENIIYFGGKAQVLLPDLPAGPVLVSLTLPNGEKGVELLIIQ